MSETVPVQVPVAWPGQVRVPRLERHGVLVALVLMGWLTVVLGVDHSGSLTTQRLLGVATWAVLAASLVWATPLVRVQTIVVVAFATVVEYTFSPGLEVYVYRFENVPAYVPPGHGLVYLSAFALGHHPWVRRNLRLVGTLVVGALGLWVLSQVMTELSGGRGDVLGAFWFLCLLGFLRWGPSKEVYVGAAVVVTWLELVGTHLRTWVWQPEDPILGMSMGNPPTGAAGGYGWFDLAALLAAPILLAAYSRLRGRSGGPLSRSEEGRPDVAVR